jgi:hypothetical protein
VTLVASAQRLLTLAHQLGLEAGDPIYDDLRRIGSETQHLPLGSERTYWDSEALRGKDAAIERAESWAREFGLNTCRLITERFPRQNLVPPNEAT